jgi:NAD(P)-dependent dehydrogenase (short-subunit alcohol dehydrogenase family)
MNLGLRGHVALVVGGTGLIGRAVIERLRTEGATAVAASRHVVDGITLDAQDPDQVLTAVDAKAMSFLRLANAALPIMARAGYGRIVGVSGQNAFLTGNVTPARSATPP